MIRNDFFYPLDFLIFLNKNINNLSLSLANPHYVLYSFVFKFTLLYMKMQHSNLNR